jgi:hypothetical protein
MAAKKIVTSRSGGARPCWWGQIRVREGRGIVSDGTFTISAAPTTSGLFLQAIILLRSVLFPYYRGEGNLVAVPPGPHTIQLQLNLDVDEYPSYRVTVPLNANESLEQHGLKSRTMPDKQRAVIVSIPSGALPPGDYKLSLEGERTARGGEPIAQYQFRVEQAQ